jgi:hypothetical protein
VLHHPLLYLSVRWADFRAVLTTPDPDICHLAQGGVTGPPELLQRLGMLARMRPQDRFLIGYARAFVGTPVFSHVAWGLAAIVLLVSLLRRGAPADRLICGLLLAALLFSLSFFFLSIACDYRYLLFLDLAVMAALLYASEQNFLTSAERFFVRIISTRQRNNDKNARLFSWSKCLRFGLRRRHVADPASDS